LKLEVSSFTRSKYIEEKEEKEEEEDFA